MPPAKPGCNSAFQENSETLVAQGRPQGSSCAGGPSAWGRCLQAKHINDEQVLRSIAHEAGLEEPDLVIDDPTVCEEEARASPPLHTHFFWR